MVETKVVSSSICVAISKFTQDLCVRLKYAYHAYDPKVKEPVYEHIINGNGTRATARLLGISKDTVTSLLKKIESLVWQS